MQTYRLFGKLAMTCIVAQSVVLIFSTPSATAQTGSATYAFVVASGFLCEGSESGVCPAIAESAAGDRYEISGAGTFDSRSKSANAAGTFTHKSANGTALETGIWIATDLISFRSYGVAPAAVVQKNSAYLRQQFGPKRLPLGLRPMPTGGLAVLRISLLSSTGTSKTTNLELNCALGDVPRERSVEGIRLSFDRNTAEFTELSGARVMFLSIKTPNATVTTQKAPSLQPASTSPQ